MLQGFWPDGVYTAPTDEALASDIRFTKSLGMNLLRKHIKVTRTSGTGSLLHSNAIHMLACSRRILLLFG
jgi:hypothetical protein